MNKTIEEQIKELVETFQWATLATGNPRNQPTHDQTAENFTYQILSLINTTIEECLPDSKSLDNVGEFNFGWNFAIDQTRATAKILLGGNNA